MTREEALEYIHEWLKDEYALDSKDREALDMAIKALEQKTCEYYDPEIKTCRRSEVPSETGRWIRDKDWKYHCNKCGAKAPFSWTDGEGFDRMVTPYCPQCGAEMEEWEDTDEEWYVHRDEVYGKAESEG